MGPPKLADTLQISLKEAEQLFDEYAQSFPKLNKWLESQGNFGRTNGYIRLAAPHNGIRWFSELMKLYEEEDPNFYAIAKVSAKVQRDSMNTPIQGTGAAIVKEAMIEARKLLFEYDGYMLPPIHDELNFEIRDDQAIEFNEKCSDLMERVGNKYVKHVKMKVDGTVDKKWVK